MHSDLVERVQRFNDHKAFEQLMIEFQSPVRQFLRRLTNQNFAIADEIAQETFLKAYMHIKTYRGDGKFLSWLFKIAYQQFITVQRKKIEYSNAELPDTAQPNIAENQFIAERTIKALIPKLKADERACILLHYSHEMSHLEISEIMERPLGTIKSIIRRGREKLMVLYQENNLGESNERQCF